MRFLPIILVLAGCPSPRAAAPATAPDDRGIGAYLERAAADGFTGAALVAIDGEVVLARGYGWADEAAGEENTVDTRFIVASISKTLTAAAIGRLVGEGRLGLDDPIARHLPGVPDDKHAITIAQLLNHTSGLPDEYLGESAPERDDAARAILAAPLAAAPGERWAYSNDGYALLGAIIERTSGEPFETYVHRELLGPAGMTSSAYFWEERQPAGVVAHGYNRGDDHDPLRRPPIGWGRRGVGGLISTVADLHRWATALDAGAIVPLDVQRAMLDRVVPVREGLDDALGWFVLAAPDGGRVLYHGGNDTPAGYTAEIRRYLDDGIVTVIASNRMVDDVGPVGLDGEVGRCVAALLFGGSVRSEEDPWAGSASSRCSSTRTSAGSSAARSTPRTTGRTPP
jgi:CubicO group peptidase (beta-lactamase class C family)